MKIQLKFKGKWRSYQQNVLNNLTKHLKDSKLHIVAAPGAGKTTLGIEVISKLNRPALILAPTLTIRNQWKERILSDFANKSDEKYISFDLKNPKTITISTYQSLWSAFSGKKIKGEEEYQDENDDNDTIKTSIPKTAKQVISGLVKEKIELVCLDEAHHLRKEWWKSLDYLISELKPKQTLALTATPPYDVSYNEWKRYEELCGPIDDSISIPELVKNGDLCPHQDFVYFSSLKQNEANEISVFENKVQEFLTGLYNNQKLAFEINKLNCFSNTWKYKEWIYEDPDFFISMVSFQRLFQLDIPKEFLKLFDLSLKEIPLFDEKWGEIFLNGLLFKYRSSFPKLEVKLKKLYKQCINAGIIFQKRISITNNPLLKKEIATSTGKLESINTIIETENSSMQEKLRMVILADFIREDMGEKTANSLGVVPIFMKIISRFKSKLSIAILTGTLVVIPKATKESLLKECKLEGLDVNCVHFKTFKQCSDYYAIDFMQSAKSKLVHIMTNLFSKGIFKIIVGTQALLGEGWDAPCINSLILSSTISSYVLSNQMRGRAIRKDKNNPEKISNIWHLASFKKLNLWNNISLYQTTEDLDYGYDLRQIVKRFECYEAPGISEPIVIQNGLLRLGIDTYNLNEKELPVLNQKMLTLSKNRLLTKQNWEKALYTGSITRSAVHSGFQPSYHQKSFTFKGTFLFLMCFYTGISLELYNVIRHINSLYAIITSICFAGYFMLGNIIRFIRNGSVVGSMRSIIQITMKTLAYMGIIQTPLSEAHILIDKSSKGEIFCSVSGLAPAELNTLMTAVQEILNPIENPRYIIIRHAIALKFIKQKDYHALPTVISTHKKYAMFFQKTWNKYIGKCEIRYTRTDEGRELLLKTRKFSFSSGMRDRTRQISKWS